MPSIPQIIQRLTLGFTQAVLSLNFVISALPATAADSPAAKEGSGLVRNLKFDSAEVLPELRLHCGACPKIRL
jgi:hypothetical protein